MSVLSCLVDTPCNVAFIRWSQQNSRFSVISFMCHLSRSSAITFIWHLSQLSTRHVIHLNHVSFAIWADSQPSFWYGVSISITFLKLCVGCRHQVSTAHTKSYLLRCIRMLAVWLWGGHRLCMRARQELCSIWWPSHKCHVVSQSFLQAFIVPAWPLDWLCTKWLHMFHTRCIYVDVKYAGLT